MVVFVRHDKEVDFSVSCSQQLLCHGIKCPWYLVKKNVHLQLERYKAEFLYIQ